MDADDAVLVRLGQGSQCGKIGLDEVAAALAHHAEYLGRFHAHAFGIVAEQVRERVHAALEQLRCRGRDVLACPDAVHPHVRCRIAAQLHEHVEVRQHERVFRPADPAERAHGALAQVGILAAQVGCRRIEVRLDKLRMPQPHLAEHPEGLRRDPIRRARQQAAHLIDGRLPFLPVIQQPSKPPIDGVIARGVFHAHPPPSKKRRHKRGGARSVLVPAGRYSLPSSLAMRSEYSISVRPASAARSMTGASFHSASRR